MSYRITKSNGTLLTTVADYTTDSSTSLTLLGRGTPNYGQLIAENFVYLLENFSGPNEPTNPIIGQIWFQTTDNTDPLNPINKYVAKVFTGNMNNGNPKGWMEIGGTNASSTPPSDPNIGELWMNTNTNTLYEWDGTKWRALTIVESETQPADPLGGSLTDGTMWLMLPEKMLWVYDSSITLPEPPFTRSGGSQNGNQVSGGWRLVGPDAPTNKGIYNSYMSLKDIQGIYHDVMISFIDGYPIYLTSSSSFVFDGTASGNLKNFQTLYGSQSNINITSGLNINNSYKNSDGSINYSVMNGTAINSSNLNNIPSTSYLGRGDHQDIAPTIPYKTLTVNFGSTDFRWASSYSNDICPGNSDVNNPDISKVNIWGKSASSAQTDKLVNRFNITLLGDTLGSGSTDGSFEATINTSLSDGIKNQLSNAQNTASDGVNRANNAQNTANEALDLARQANNSLGGYIPLSGSANISGDLGNGNNHFGNVYSQWFHGTATSAEYSDLAEYYHSDEIYSYGTIVKLGGDKEITLCDIECDTEVFGVVSHQPAFIMNSGKVDDPSYLPVALKGRVPVRVIGSISKGDFIIPYQNGVGRSVGKMSDILTLGPTERELIKSSLIGRSLENKFSSEEGIVECVVSSR